MKTPSTILTIQIQSVETRYFSLKHASYTPTFILRSADLSQCQCHTLCVSRSLTGLLAHWPSFLLFQNTFVGLTNLGATCYVNTFLQVWFHNLELRRSLYECNNSRAQEHNTDSGISDTCVFQAFVELGFPLSCFFYSYFQIMSPSPSVSICSICLRSCRTATGSTSTPRVWSKLWAWTLASSRYITKLN